MSTESPERVAVIKLGGSATIGPEGVSKEYVKQLISELYSSLDQYAHVVFVIGGGKRVKDVIKNLRENGAQEDEQDLAGIDILVEHAQQLQECIFDVLYELGLREEVESAPTSVANLQEKVQNLRKRFLVVSGLQKGQSTDTNAVLAAEAFEERADKEFQAIILFLSNVWHAWTDDPKPENNPLAHEARPIRRANIQVLSEQQNARGFPVLPRGSENYHPGSPGILDPVAVERLARKPRVGVYYTHADNVDDMKRFLTGQEPEEGTIFVPEEIETEYYATSPIR